VAYGDLIQFDGRMVVQEPNPCVRTYGLGPDGARCKTCELLQSREYANTYYKCSLRANTGGAGTDHRVNWKACAKYKLRASGRWRNTR
jgi:hypothetical protein